MALARSVSVLLSAAVVSSFVLLTVTGCSGKTVGGDLIDPVTPTDPTDPTNPTDPVDPGKPCPDIAPACDPGDENVGSESNCQGADYCYSRTIACSKTTAWCAHRTVQCAAYPSCDPDDNEVKTCPGGTGVTCYPRTICGTTILCAHRDACKALPSCNAGDQEVTEVDTCMKPGITCYSRSACNFTIYCFTPP